MSEDFQKTATPNGDQQRGEIKRQIRVLQAIADNDNNPAVERMNARLMLERLS